MAREIFITYCDDIREEIGGKVSLIGCYPGDIILSQIPAVLSKFCISVVITTPIDDLFKSLTIKVFRDDEVLVEHSIPVKDLQTYQNQASTFIDTTDPDRLNKLVISANLTISPLYVEKSCKIKVKAFSEVGELKGRAIKLTATSSPVSAE